MAKRKKSPTPKSGRNPDRQNRSRSPQTGSGKLWLYGNHAVEAALTNPRRQKFRLLVNQDWKASFNASDVSIEPEFLARRDIERQLPPGAAHQGLALQVAPLEDSDIETICRDADDNAIVVILDQVTDPQNIGAIMRSATAFDVSAIIVPDKHTPEATAVLAKAASGALDRLPMARVTNLVRALGQLKEAGFWTVGLDADASQTLAEAKLSGKLAIIMGAEGKGLRRLTAENCDFLVKIPIAPVADNLNVSAAAAITLYEIARNS
ncbi:MAG: 23S rRNA (guanosine(2251)-2'-O)-methyltransferase RlmB [Rhodospirillales bacterium]|nr:23S rRNA (guanosine(2251)-2'-O)-methyltransferase RlmB [Rhodospirillales bacterium]